MQIVREKVTLDELKKMSEKMQYNLVKAVVEPIDTWIEFDSIINLRPSYGNRNRGVDDIKTQGIIKKIVNAMVVR